MEPTRKSESEGKYLLVTTKSNLYCAQQEADTLLEKFYKKANIRQPNWNTRKTQKTIVHNHFSIYATALQKKNPTTTTTPTRSNTPSYYRPVTIPFNTNDKHQNYEKSPPSLKRKTQHESHSVVSNTTANLTHPEAGREEILADLVAKNNIQLTNKVDEKNEELKDSILSNVNNTLKSSNHH